MAAPKIDLADFTPEQRRAAMDHALLEAALLKLDWLADADVDPRHVAHAQTGAGLIERQAQLLAAPDWQDRLLDHLNRKGTA